MKILNLNNFISERLSIQPVKLNIKPGDNVKENDFIVMGFTENGHRNIWMCEYHDGLLRSNNGNFDWAPYKDAFEGQTTDGDFYGKVIAIYRPLNEANARRPQNNKYNIVPYLKSLKSDGNYICVYKNKEATSEFELDDII